MKLKYYLRGLGIGMIVAVLIMMLAFKIHGSSMTDEQIIDRAEKLGMVMPENGTVADQPAEGEEDGSQDPQLSDDENVDPGEDDKKISDDDSGNEDTVKPKDDQADVSGNDNQTEPDSQSNAPQQGVSTDQPADTVTFVIAPGEFSDVISQNLAAAGLVADAEAYNEWLMDTNYDNLLQPGTYVIPVGASDEEIAKILTTKEE